jgi:ABC-type glycerol-3-phosphate transport system substrate-binding protein
MNRLSLRTSLSRRAVLSGTVFAAVGMVVAACGASTQAPNPTAAATAATTAATQAPNPTAATPAANPTAAVTAATPAANPTVAPTAAAGLTKSTGPVTIVWEHGYSGGKYPENIIASFQQKFSNAKIDFRAITFDNTGYAKMYAEAAAGNMGDVVPFLPAHYQMWPAAKRGVIRPIDDLLKSDNYDLNQFFPPYVDQQRWEGKIWGLPGFGWTGHDAIILNTKSFADAGVPVPEETSPNWTLEGIYEMAVKLTKQNKSGSGDKIERYGLQIVDSNIQVVPQARAYLGEVLNAEGTKIMLGEGGGLKAAKWAYDLVVTEKVVPLTGTFSVAQGQTLFALGRLAMYQGGSLESFTAPATIKDPSLVEIKMLLLPKRPDGKWPNQLRAGAWQINSKSQNPEWSFEFIKYLSSREGILTFNKSGQGSFVRPDIFDDPYFTDNKYFPVWSKSRAVALLPNFPANFRGTEMEDAMTNNFDAMWLGQVGWDAGIKQVVDAMQKVVDKPIA